LAGTASQSRLGGPAGASGRLIRPLSPREALLATCLGLLAVGGAAVYAQQWSATERDRYVNAESDLALARGARALEVLQGAHTEAELLFRDELLGLTKTHPQLSWQPVVAGTGAGDNPELERLVLERYVDADADRTRHFWICAVGDLVRRLREALRAAGYERRAIRYEQW